MPISISGDGSIGPLSATEVGYLDGVTSAVQTQINGKLTTPGVWTSYTPILTGFTPGNGTSTGKYTVAGKICIWWAEFIFGSTSTAATAWPKLSLPSIGLNASAFSVINAMFINAAGTYYLASGVYETPTGPAMLATPGTNGIWTQPTTTVPFTWQTNSYLRASGVCEVA